MLHQKNHRPLAGLAVACSCALSHAQTVPEGFVVEQLATGLTRPTCAAIAPDGRVFIAQKEGVLRVWSPDDGLLPTPFHTFDVDSEGERGFIGLALDPNFPDNGLVYAHISRAGPQAGPDIVRIAASAANPNVADPASATVLLPLGAYVAVIHVGGALHFGPDAKLYVGFGDNANTGNAQNLTTIYGKVLRFNPDGSVPKDNPFYNDTVDHFRAIWVRGLRNPFTFAFQPGSERLFINDVGAGSWEEINDATPGDNFGWPATEGDFDPLQFPEFTRPIYAYHHVNGPVNGQVITGGVFYNTPNPSFPADYTSDYFFADLTRAWVKRLDTTTRTVLDFAADTGGVVDLDVDSQGRLLMLAFSGRLLRVSSSLCRADFNADSILNSSDFFDYLTAFFENEASADFNADATLNSQDFFDYVNAFLGGC